MRELITQTSQFCPFYCSLSDDHGWLTSSFKLFSYIPKSRLRGVCKRTRGFYRSALVYEGVHIVYHLDLAILNSHCFQQRCKTFSKRVGQRCDFAVRSYTDRETNTLIGVIVLYCSLGHCIDRFFCVVSSVIVNEDINNNSKKFGMNWIRKAGRGRGKGFRCPGERQHEEHAVRSVY